MESLASPHRTSACFYRFVMQELSRLKISSDCLIAFWLLAPLCALTGCGSRAGSPAPVSTAPPKADPAEVAVRQAKATAAEKLSKMSDEELDARLGPEVKSFCSHCHAAPEAAEAPREEWRHEVEQAYNFHKHSPR